MYRVAILFCAIIGIQSSPTNFAPCKKEDTACQTKISNVIYKEIIEGNPSLDIENLDPMYQEYIEGNLATLNYKLKKSEVQGFKDCDIINTKLLMEEKIFRLEMYCPLFSMNGLYEIGGQLLGMPIEGNGDFKVSCKDYYVNIDTDLKVTEKNGEKYLSFKSFKVEGDIRGGMILDMKNLFNGQKELADNVLRFMNENWKPVAQFMQGPVFSANVKRLVKNFNKYLKTKPLDTLITL